MPMQLSPLDLISTVMDRPARPLDFAFVLHLRDAPSYAALAEGGASARREFPSTAAILDGKVWRHAPTTDGALRVRDVDDSRVQQTVEEYVDAPWDLGRTPPVQQLVVTGPGSRGAVLVTRFHHAAADGLSAAMWLRHQLDVTWGARAPTSARAPHLHPELKRHAAARRVSAFAFGHPSDRLQVDSRPPSATRRWRTIAWRSGVPRAPLTGDGGVSYNDRLATSALETFRIWNAARVPGRAAEVGLWLPINIRAQPLKGFGNGSSRIRVYNRYPADATFHEKCRAVRRQVDWSRAQGEWAVPEHGWLRRLPMPVLKPLLRAYFNRPWVDMGTGVFSHMQRSPLDDLRPDQATRVEVIGMLDTRHPFGISAISIGDVTYLTFVHDPAQIRDAEAAELVAIYERQLALAVVEHAA